MVRKLTRSALTTQHQQLLDHAEAASRTAWCPHSGFAVGAALLLETPDGAAVATGVNFETANYNSVCAEKAALAQAFNAHSWIEGSQLRRPRVLAVAVYCATGLEPQLPCGDCRQALHDVNPEMVIIAASGPAHDGRHDPRVAQTNVRAILPHGFVLNDGGDRPAPRIEDSQHPEEYVVHLPRADTMSCDVEQRLELLRGVEHMLLVGSPRRARRVVELAQAKLGAAGNVDDACYCDLTVPGRDESGREYAVYVVALPDGQKVAVASHGIGPAGAEIIISELPAAIALAQGGKAPHIKGILRAGTRGTLSEVPLGCVALSTRTCDPAMDTIHAHDVWLDRLRDAARSIGMICVPEDDIDERNQRNDWPEATRTLVEGLGLSAPTFWENQGRPLYKAHAQPEPGEDIAKQRRADMLERWRRYGVHWIEMEDFAVHRVAASCGYPSATLGAVIAHRRRPDGVYQLDYSKEALAASEMIPTELALRAIIHAGSAQ